MPEEKDKFIIWPHMPEEKFQRWIKWEFGENPKRSRHCDCEQTV